MTVKKKKIDDYISIKEKDHENTDFIKGVTLNRMQELSEKNSMPVYEKSKEDGKPSPDLNNKSDKKKMDKSGMPIYNTPSSSDSKDKSNEEE